MLRAGRHEVRALARRSLDIDIATTSQATTTTSMPAITAEAALVP